MTPQTTTRNEAADFVRERMERSDLLDVDRDVDAALAEERRLVVEQLKERWFDHPAVQDGGAYVCACEGAGHHADIERVLDEVAGEEPIHD